jgi:molybdate transport system substrate-binding protein
MIAWSVAITSPLAAQPVDRDLRVATASNFATVMKVIAVRFEEATGHRITLIVGSTGKHYAQVLNGAPFDVLFAADTLRPALLERGGQAVAGTRFTYAKGKLVLWSSTPDLVDSDAVVLENGNFRHLAIANPTLAPYGAAAREVMEAMALWDLYSQRLVRGENVSHAFNFVRSGNAELGFVAYSQVADPNRPAGGSLWIVPPSLYSPIEQQAVLLRDTDAARRLLAFVRSDEALSIIQAHGYDIPDAH